MNDAEQVEDFLPAARYKEAQAVPAISTKRRLVRDENSVAASKIGELDDLADATACQAIALSKKELCNLHWRKSATRVVPVVQRAVAKHARARGEGISFSDAVVGRAPCK